MEEFENLIGKTIEKIIIDTKYGQYINFITNDEPVGFVAVGDCCSRTYISEFVNVANLLGQKIDKIEELKLLEGDCLPRPASVSHEEEEIYGVKFHTEKGTAVLVYRNESNGYYGGSMDRRTLDLEGKAEAKELTTDFQLD